MDTLELGIEAPDGTRPRRIPVELRKIAPSAPIQLVVQQCDECGRTAAERDHFLWHARRLAADRNGDGAFRLGREQEGVASRQAAERTEFVPGGQYLRRADAA